MKLSIAVLFALAILIPLMSSVDAQARRGSGLMAYRARQLRALRARQMQFMRMKAMHRRRRRARSIPPWVYFIEEPKADDDAAAEESSDDAAESDEKADADDDAEIPNEKGQKRIELEDMQLWKTMDLNKDGKLTIAEYERFARSPAAQKFVRGMKQHKAVEQWSAKMGIDVAKAKAAMMLGANAQRRRSYINRQRNARILAHRRRAAIARRNRMVARKRHQRRTNYWARLGINPFLRQQYYSAMKQSAGRRGGEL